MTDAIRTRARDQQLPRDAAESGFILDADQLKLQRQHGARRMHAVLMPAMRLGGFLILCLIAVQQDWRTDPDFPAMRLWRLCALDIGYAVLSWMLLWRAYEPAQRVDWSLLFLHLDVVMWLLTLNHVESHQSFFAFLLLVRVGDQVGFGFRRAVYFNHVVVTAYLVYAVLQWLSGDSAVGWTERLSIAAMMYLIGNYIAITGFVIERLRDRSRNAVRTARELVQRLERQARELRAQAQELEQARTLAEQASLAKSQFLAMISHEIRTPMNGILGATELLLASGLGGPQRKLAQTAHSSSTALLSIIDDVLDVSRIEAGKLALHAARFNLHRLVDEVIDLMSASAHQKSLELAGRVGPGVPLRLHGDAVRLRQLLVNLLGNAVKFTSRGSVSLDVTLQAGSISAVRLRFDVRDTGIGIPATQLQQIFEPFTQADASTTRRYGGSGLGLAIVKQLAGLMGGQVGVDSAPDQGSLFWLELPFERVPEEAAPPTVAAPLAEAGGHVLLAEDNVVNQMVLSEMLSRLGCSVEVVGDGREAVQAMTARPGAHYDLVFMDCHMPEMDGYEATRRIREYERLGSRHTPIVALTAAVLAEDRALCLASGMDDFLSKPVSLERLREALARWCAAGAG